MAAICRITSENVYQPSLPQTWQPEQEAQGAAGRVLRKVLGGCNLKECFWSPFLESLVLQFFIAKRGTLGDYL
jgi:hypothetical protein